jgi:hypothetical protein
MLQPSTRHPTSGGACDVHAIGLLQGLALSYALCKGKYGKFIDYICCQCSAGCPARLAYTAGPLAEQ